MGFGQTTDVTGSRTLSGLERFNLVKFVGRRDGYFIADFGLLLPDGKISLSAAGRFSEFEEVEEGGKFSVTGGTDAYKDVRGEATVQVGQTMCDQKGTLITLDLLLQ